MASGDKYTQHSYIRIGIYHSNPFIYRLDEEKNKEVKNESTTKTGKLVKRKLANYSRLNPIFLYFNKNVAPKIRAQRDADVS